MTEMTEAQKVIEDVMANHLPTTVRVQSTVRPDVYRNEPACKGCDWVGKGFLDSAHRAHVSVEIDKALGGLETWIATENGGPKRTAWVSGWSEARQ